MNEERDDYMSAQRTAGEWYVALDARAPHGADDTARMMDACFAEWLTRSSAHEAELERCEAAVTLAQALADDPDLAFAYAEARALASRPRPAALRALHGHSSASAVGASRRLWPAFAGLAAAAAVVVVAATAFVDRSSSPVGRAVAVATAIVASSPPVNGAVLLPPNEFVVDARTLSVLPLVPAVEGAAADARTRTFAAALERELIAALRSVPGLHLLDAAPVPANAAAELAPSEIGRLLGARGIVQGRLRETPSGPEIELVLLDASTDTLLWENRYRARATDAIAADAIPSIAAAIVATSEDDARAGSARAVNALTSFGEAEGAAE